MTSAAPPRPAASSSSEGGSSAVATWLLWTAGFLVFPFAGLAGTAAAGPVDDPLAALLGGAVAGLAIGVGQAVVSRRRLPALRWSAATAVGMGVGLLLGASVVGYATGLGDLALQGEVTEPGRVPDHRGTEQQAHAHPDGCRRGPPQRG